MPITMSIDHVVLRSMTFRLKQSRIIYTIIQPNVLTITTQEENKFCCRWQVDFDTTLNNIESQYNKQNIVVCIVTWSLRTRGLKYILTVYTYDISKKSPKLSTCTEHNTVELMNPMLHHKTGCTILPLSSILLGLCYWPEIGGAAVQNIGFYSVTVATCPLWQHYPLISSIVLLR